MPISGPVNPHYEANPELFVIGGPILELKERQESERAGLDPSDSRAQAELTERHLRQQEYLAASVVGGESVRGYFDDLNHIYLGSESSSA